ncbi:MAG: class I SAM-dependent methyltransferase [Marinilabiliaceae bacterium]|nr:class I SAM-dependent methyltransferase [Marinilabiliaceae bacterium]
MAKTESFDKYPEEYEQWFLNNHFVFISELEAIRQIIPSTGNGVEIGVGSGIFASALNITDGCDPSAAMRTKAKERGINAIYGVAENLPYKDESFDFVLMITTICFVDDANSALKEIYRILKPGGYLVTGFVDKDSFVGKQYILKKNKSLFYKDAKFYSTIEITTLLNNNNFSIEETLQTIFGPMDKIEEKQQPEKGFGKGSFVVIKAVK